MRGLPSSGPVKQNGRVWDTPLRRDREASTPCGPAAFREAAGGGKPRPYIRIGRNVHHAEPDAPIEPCTQVRRAHAVRPCTKTEGIPQGWPPGAARPSVPCRRPLPGGGFVRFRNSCPRGPPENGRYGRNEKNTCKSF